MIPAGFCINATCNSLLVSASVANFMLSLPCNAGVVWLLLRSNDGLMLSDLFVFNLSLLELIICPTELLSNVLIYNLLPFALSKSFMFLSGLKFLARPFLQCCICVERYLAVVHPVAFLKYKALRYKLNCLAFVWLCTFAMCLVNLYIENDIKVTAVFLVILFIETFCSLSILRVLRQPRPGDGEREEMNTMKRRAFTNVLVIQATTVFCYLPTIIVTILEVFFSFQYTFCYLFPIAYTFIGYGSFMHALFYLHRAGKLPCLRKSARNQ